MSKTDKTKYPRRHITTDLFTCVFSYKDVTACELCYDPVEWGVLPSKQWRGTVQDIVDIPASKFPKKGVCVGYYDDEWGAPTKERLAMGHASDKGFVISELAARCLRRLPCLDFDLAGELMGNAGVNEYTKNKKQLQSGLKKFAKTWADEISEIRREAALES